MLNLGLKTEKLFQNEYHADDWDLGSHPHVKGKLSPAKFFQNIPYKGFILT